MSGFINKNVVITGASAGIGLAAARYLGRLGARLVICGTGQAKLKAAVDALKNEGIFAEGFVCDVGQGSQMADLARFAMETLGVIDIWINNAGIYPQYRIIDTPEEVLDSLLAINMKSIYHSAKLARQYMKKGGVLLNASSFAAVLPSIGSGMYAATKSAVSSMTRTLAGELAPYGIRVNAYIPGVIRTQMTSPLLEDNEEAMVSPIALQRIGEPEDVAAAIAFLCGEEAAYITGTVLEISGGKFAVQNPAKAWQIREKELQAEEKPD